MKKISIITLGCKVNLVESENLAERLKKDGYDVSMGLGDVADIYVINTCAVTNEAERKSRNIISKVRKLNADALVYDGLGIHPSEEGCKGCCNRRCCC